MKKIIRDLIKYISLAALLLTASVANGQIGNFEISVRNITQTAANRLEFDVYLLDTDPIQPFELASCQLGFLFNSLIYAGGTISASIDNTGSGLNSSQQFTATPGIVTSLTGYPNQTLIRLAGRTAPGAGNGTIISTTGYGTLLTHFNLTSTVDFAESSTPDIIFNSSSVMLPLYATRVGEYIETVNTPLVVTPGDNAIVFGNPILNPPVPVAPVANAAENITCSGFTASWQASSGAVSYRLDVSMDEDFSSFVNGYKDLDVGEELKHEVTGLTGSTNYYYRVRAVNAFGASANSNTISCLTSPPVPAAPSAQAGSGATCTQFTANWSASANALSYRLDVSLSSSFTSYVSGYQDRNVGNVTSFNVSGLTGSTTYYYRLRAVNDCGTSGNSNVISYVTAPPVPDAPAAISASGITCSQFRANWNASANALSYRLDVSVSPDFNTYVTGYQDRNAGNLTSFEVTGLTGSTTYYYRVRAVNDCGTSGNSNVITTETAPPIPPAPVANAASSSFCTQFQANWSASLNALSYRLDVSTSATFSTYVSGYQDLNVLNVTSYTVTGLEGSTTYYYRLRAVNACGTSGNSNVISATTAPPTPPAPVASAAGSISCSQAIASWSASANALSYRLDVSTSNTFSSFVAGYNNLNVGNVLTLNITGLAGATNYYYRVRAVNECGTSVSSNTISFTTAPPTPSAPVATAGTGATCTQLNANWNASANALSYRLDVSTSNTFSSFVTGFENRNVGNVTTFIVTGLTGSTVYYYRVRAVNDCGTSGNSNVITYTTAPPTPAPPVANAGSGATCSQITANWSSSLNALSYRLDVSTSASFSTYVPGYQDLNVLNVTSYTVSGLTGNTTYYYRVRAVNDCGTSGNSNTISYTTAPPVPAAPAAGPGSGTTCTQITANWSASTYALSYRLDVSTSNSFASFVTGCQDLNVGNVLSWDVTGLTGSTTYYYRVRAVNACGTSGNSNVISYATAPPTPEAPVASAGTNATCTGIRANWNASANALLYRLDVSTSNTFSTFVPGYQDLNVGNVLTYSVTGLTGSTTYYYRVRAVNACGTSGNSNVISYMTAPPTPAAPLAGAATNATCSQLTANWSASANTLSYRLDVSTSGTFSTYVSGYQDLNVGNALFFNVTGLTGGTTYYYRVRAVNDCGTSGSSNVINVTTAPETPVAPVAAAASDLSCSSVTASWSAPANTLSYRLDVSTSSSFTTYVSGYQNLNVSNVTSYSITGLSGGTSYYYRVRAVNDCGTSANSNVISFTTYTVSTAPTGVLISNNNTCSGTSKTLTVSGGSLGTDAVWEWFTGSCGGTSAGSGLSITVDPPAGTSTIYYVRASGACNTTACSSGTVIVSPSVGTPSIPQPSASSICQGSGNTTYTTLAANATSYNWSVTGTGNSISGTGTTGTVTWSPSFTGVATVSVVANGCNGPSAPASTTVTVNPLPVPTLSSSDPDNAFCAGTSITFTAGGGTNYNFRVNGSGVQNSSQNTFTTNSLLDGQVVDVVVTNSNNCSAVSAGITNTVYPLPTPSLISSDGDNIFCAGTSVTFTAGGGDSYNFRVGGVSVQNGSSDTYTTGSLTNGQIVDVIVTNTGTGCSATSVQIPNFVNSLPSIYVSTAPACSSDLLTYSLGVTVSSGVVTSTAGTVVNVSGNVWTISGVTSGTDITVTVTDPSSCVNTLAVNSPNCSCPVINAPVSGGDKGYCQGESVPSISASVPAGHTVDWYSASSGGALLASGSPTFTPSEPGTYWALARQVTTGCVSSTRTPVTVTMYSLPVPSLSSSDTDNRFCTGTSVTFSAGGGTNYNFRVDGQSVQSGTLNSYTTASLTDGQVVDVIVTNENGCIAISSGIVNTVYPLPVPSLVSSDNDNTFCLGTTVTFTGSGGTNYNFRVGGVSVQNGSTSTYTTSSLTNGQVVDVIVTNSNGCSATSAGITNIVNPLPTPTLTSSDNDNAICEGTGITFTATGGATYNFRVNGTSVQNGTSSTYTTTTLAHNQVLDVVVTNANGCSAASNGIATTVYTMPVADAGSGGNECDLTFQLKASSSNGIGTWTRTSGPGTASFNPSSNSPDAIVTVSAYGTYTFTWTEVNGLCSDNDVITVNFYQQPVADAGEGGNNCGLQFHLDGSMNIGTGTWTRESGPGDAVFAPNANTPGATVNVSTYGNYVFRWTVVNGTCSNSATVNVSFFEQPAANAGEGGDECDNDFVLNAVPAASGSWSLVSGPGTATFIPDRYQADATVTVTQFGTYTFAWTISNVICESTDQINVSFHDLPAVDAGRDTIICEDGYAQLQATGTGSFLWDPATELTNPDIANPLASPEETTLYTVTLTDQYGCQNSDQVEVEVWNMPVADAGPDLELDYVFETPLQAAVLNTNETGTWSVFSGSGTFTDPDNPSTTVRGLEPGENIILWSVTNNVCPAVDDYITITVSDLLIPSLITPNGDPFNEFFYLGGLPSTLGRTELIIFDRRGAQVYKNSNYDNSWNGLDNNGKELPEDTYFYVIKAQNGRSHSGYVVIRR